MRPPKVVIEQVDPIEEASRGLEAETPQSPGGPHQASQAPSIALGDQVKVGTLMYRGRHRQIKQEALNTDSKEWEVIERALEMYFRATGQRQKT